MCAASSAAHRILSPSSTTSDNETAPPVKYRRRNSFRYSTDFSDSAIFTRSSFGRMEKFAASANTTVTANASA